MTAQGFEDDDVLQCDHRPRAAPGSDAELPTGDKEDEGAYKDGLYGGDLTLYERKSLLINRELDAMGLGRYQKCIWLLCGFGYMLELLWAQAFGLIATPLYQELNVTGGAQTILVKGAVLHQLTIVATDLLVLDFFFCADIFTAFSAGLTVGAFTFGLGVDVIGRKWCFNLTCLITSIFGLLVASPSNYNTICGLTAFCGFGLGGNIPIDATIVLEFLPQNRRWLLPLLSMWQPVGVVLNCTIAFGLVPRYRCNTDLLPCELVQSGAACCTRSSNIGWRLLMIVCGAITLSVFVLQFFVFDFLEAPKYLLARGRDAEAIKVVHKIAAFNRVALPQLSIAEFEAIDCEFPQQEMDTSKKSVVKQTLGRFKHLRGLFDTKRLGFTTVLLWIVYMGDFWSFNLAASFLPIILARRGQTAGQSVTETYRLTIYVYLPGILGTVLAAACVELPGAGRKWSLVFGAIVQGVSTAMYTQVDTIKASVGLNALEYTMQSFFNAVLYGFTPGVFPAPIRGSAAGLCSTFGRLAGIVAPIAARPYIDGNSNGVLWLAVGGISVSAFFLVFLPIETRGRASY
ncbi:BQ2448_5924 [Microbotryum intermedium]|uniref:BQ2448_5924 protein n=1 Tax=Microbotryum intermedium TaxID=269621 RepID=A0A238F7X9_9BASI|nr:BQ2448_5924 [Microbotryum intermedium]